MCRTGCATARLRRVCGVHADAALDLCRRGLRARSSWWPGNGGSVDCSRRIIRYCPAHKKRPGKQNELAEIIGAGLQPRLRRAAGPCGGISDPSDQADRALCRGRPDRRARPHGRRISQPRPEAARRGREQGRRAGRDRRRSGGAFRARRLHAVLHGGVDLRAQSDALQEAALRSHAGFPAAGIGHRSACRDGGSSLRARQDGRGVRGLRQAKSGKTQFRIGRHRRHHSSGRRDVQANGRRRHGSCRLQGRRSRR